MKSMLLNSGFWGNTKELIFIIGIFAIIAGICYLVKKSGLHMPNKTQPIYAKIQEILDPYATTQFAKKILKYAEENLKFINKQYQFQIKSSDDNREQIYIDLIEKANDHKIRELWTNFLST